MLCPRRPARSKPGRSARPWDRWRRLRNGRRSIRISRLASERSSQARGTGLSMHSRRQGSATPAMLQNYLGYAYRRLRQVGPAMQHYQQALTLNPRHRSARASRRSLPGARRSRQSRRASHGTRAFSGKVESGGILKEPRIRFKIPAGARGPVMNGEAILR
jgi:hypothetical protein